MMFPAGYGNIKVMALFAFSAFSLRYGLGGGVPAVINGGDVRFATAEKKMRALNALVAFLNENAAVCQREGIVGVNAVVVAGQLKGTAVNGDAAVCMDCIVPAADGKCSRVCMDILRLQPLGAFRIWFRFVPGLLLRRPVGLADRLGGCLPEFRQASAAGGDPVRPAIEAKVGFSLNAIPLRINAQVAVQHIDPAAPRVGCVGRLDAVAAGGSGNYRMIEHHRVLAANGVAPAADDDIRVGDHQAVFAHNAIVILCNDPQCACTVNGQVFLGKQRAVWLVLPVGKGVGGAVCQDAFPAVCQRDNDFFRRFDMDGRAVGRCNADAVQQQLHIRVLRIDHKLAGAAALHKISAGAGDGIHTVLQLEHRAAVLRRDGFNVFRIIISGSIGRGFACREDRNQKSRH